MSQSPSLIAALEAADRVLSSDTGDLKKLAEIAGVAPEVLFQRADLTGVDLRNQDIDFLLPLEVDYLGAMLTDRQLRAFRNAGRRLKRIRISPQERNARIEKVEQFIAKYAAEVPIAHNGIAAETLTVEYLREILLLPLLEYNRRNLLLPADYISGVLQHLTIWTTEHKSRFFPDLFSLLSDLKCPISDETIALLEESWRPRFGENLGNLVAIFHGNDLLDTYWICRITFDEAYAAAMQLGLARSVDAQAVEKALGRLRASSELSWSEALTFLKNVPIECNSDQAERLATYLTRTNWPARHTREILEAKVPPNMRTAIFRQLLAQGQEDRVIEVIKWLDNNRGAAGALSLENAFSHIKDFDLALQLAHELEPRLADNQIKVIDSALATLANRRQDFERLTSFRRRYI